jgi:hypothetical protein
MIGDEILIYALCILLLQLNHSFNLNLWIDNKTKYSPIYYVNTLIMSPIISGIWSFFPIK